MSAKNNTISVNPYIIAIDRISLSRVMFNNIPKELRSTVAKEKITIAGCSALSDVYQKRHAKQFYKIKDLILPIGV